MLSKFNAIMKRHKQKLVCGAKVGTSFAMDLMTKELEEDREETQDGFIYMPISKIS